MKKLLGIAFVGMMAFGCGSGTKETKTETSTTSTTQTNDPNATPAQGDPAAGQNTAPPAQ